MKFPFKTFLTVIASFFLISSCSAQKRPDRFLDDHRNVNSMLESTVALVSTLPDRMADSTLDTQGHDHNVYCAGVFISRTEVLTAAHCVDRYRIVSFMGYNFTQSLPDSPVGDLIKVVVYRDATESEITRYATFRVAAHDQRRDIALLTYEEGLVAGTYRIADFRTFNSVNVGRQVYAVGHPAGLVFTLTDGIVSRSTVSVRYEQINSRFVQTTAPIYRGNSGGPLFDENGELCGIASSFVGAQAHLGLFVHLREMRSFLREAENVRDR